MHGMAIAYEMLNGLNSLRNNHGKQANTQKQGAAPLQVPRTSSSSIKELRARGVINPTFWAKGVGFTNPIRRAKQKLILKGFV